MSMGNPAVRKLDSMPFAQQIIVLVLLFDPLGAAGGYFVLPEVLGVEPLMGAVYGLVAASIPTSLWVMRHAQKTG
jgi:hypothetical protein